MSNSVSRAQIVLDLFEDYYERVFCFAKRSLPPEQAEDIAQEVFVRLLELKNLENLELSVSYLLKIADNLIKRSYGRAQRFTRYVKATRPDAEIEVFEDWVHRPLTDDQIVAGLERLPSHEQDAIRLIICESMSYEQASQSLGVEVSTVNNWKYRGLQKLQQYHRADAGKSGSDAVRSRTRRRCQQRPRSPESAGDHSPLSERFGEASQHQCDGFDRSDGAGPRCDGAALSRAG